MLEALKPYKVLIQVVLSLALLGGVYWKGREDEHAVAIKAQLATVEKARESERVAQVKQQEAIDAKDKAIRRVNGRLADALERLRQRPERMPEASRETCKGATGAELSGPDAAFLERFAARAESLREELKSCQ